MTDNDQLYQRLKEATHRFCQAASLAGASITDRHIRLEFAPAPHRPPASLPAGYMAVYAFFYRGHCLKVGKAGPNSGPRYTTHHYFQTAPGTLAKSLLAWEAAHHSIGCKSDPKAWMTSSLGRANFLIPANLGPAALNFLEAFMQLELRPSFEGTGRAGPSVFSS
ncbi:MAG: hypothetical protein ACT4OE_04685 [Sphingosinicella sp.]